MRLLAILTIGVSFAASAAQPLTPIALPRIGSCPSSYGSDGNYCIPSTGARFAIVKVAGSSCPSNYGSDGNYCVASGSSARMVIPKSGGSCPSSYSNEGAYCVSSK